MNALRAHLCHHLSLYETYFLSCINVAPFRISFDDHSLYVLQTKNFNLLVGSFAISDNCFFFFFFYIAYNILTIILSFFIAYVYMYIWDEGLYFSFVS